MTHRPQPTFFATPQAFRAWLSLNHRTATELLVGFYKKHTGKPSITWPEAVDQALCFGWIDGIRRRLDKQSYSIRFTPRRAGSTWSQVNIARVAALTAEGLMRPTGLAAFERRIEDPSASYSSSEQRRHARLTPQQRQRLEGNPTAWAFFQAQPPSYRRNTTFWVTSAKQDATRDRRLDRLIAACVEGRRL